MSPANPVRYNPSLEKLEAAEAETAESLRKTMRHITEKTYANDGEHAMRSVHAKNDGVLKGKIQVLDNLPPVLAQGAFAKPGTFDVVMRLSTTPGDILDDKVSTPRGLGLKIAGLAGEALPGSASGIQNFVMVNGPVFQAPSAKAFLTNLKMLAPTADKGEGVKKVISAGLQAVEKGIEALGGQSVKIMSLGGHPETHILGETFYSEAPFLFGPYIAKFAVVPISPFLIALTKKPLDMKDKPNALRDAVRDYFSSNDAEWELRVQLCTNLETMPIEDSTVQWPEDESPYIAVARITVPRGGMLSDEQAAAEEDQLSFNPWHGLTAHRPLGSINRARQPAYEDIAAFRASRNGCPIREPVKHSGVQ